MSHTFCLYTLKYNSVNPCSLSARSKRPQIRVILIIKLLKLRIILLICMPRNYWRNRIVSSHLLWIVVYCQWGAADSWNMERIGCRWKLLSVYLPEITLVRLDQTSDDFRQTQWADRVGLINKLFWPNSLCGGPAEATELDNSAPRVSTLGI